VKLKVPYIRSNSQEQAANTVDNSMLTNTQDNMFISDDVALAQRIMKLIKMKN
jgi:hypothetical protein